MTQSVLFDADLFICDLFNNPKINNIDELWNFQESDKVKIYLTLIGFLKLLSFTLAVYGLRSLHATLNFFIFEGRVKICSVGREVYHQALSLGTNDLESAIEIIIAQEKKLVLVSNNPKSYAFSPLDILSLDDFLDSHQATQNITDSNTDKINIITWTQGQFESLLDFDWLLMSIAPIPMTTNAYRLQPTPLENILATLEHDYDIAIPRPSQLFYKDLSLNPTTTVRLHIISWNLENDGEKWSTLVLLSDTEKAISSNCITLRIWEDNEQEELLFQGELAKNSSWLYSLVEGKYLEQMKIEVI